MDRVSKGKYSSLLGLFVSDEKSFIKLTPGVNVIKLFSFVTDDKPNKLEVSSMETLFSQVLEFDGKARANPIGAPFR